MKSRFLGAMFLTAVVGLGGCAEKAAKPAPEAAAAAPAPAPKPAIEAARVVQLTATVVSIDYKTRHVTLKGEDGKTKTLVVPEDKVPNFKQIKKGDQVNVDYFESLTLELEKAGTPLQAPTVVTESDRAAPGQRPSGGVAAAVTASAKITKIDKAAGVVTLVGAKGKTIELPVKDPAVFDKIKVGDVVRATYVEAVAVAVEKPGSK